MSAFASVQRERARKIRERLFNPPNAVVDTIVANVRGLSIGYVPAEIPPELVARIVPRKKQLRVTEPADSDLVDIARPPPATPPIVVEATIESEDGPTRAPFIIDVMRVVARRYGRTVLDLKSTRRCAPIVRPRQIAMYVAYKVTMHSTPRIGRAFHRDHTTVLHALRKIGAMVDSDPAIAAEVEEIVAELDRWMAS